MKKMALLALAVCFLLIWGCSLAEEEVWGENLQITSEWVTGSVHAGDGLNNDELAAAYINRMMMSGSMTVLQASAPQGASFTGANLNLYTLLRDAISEVAGGIRTSTEFTFDMADIYPRMSFTAGDLGVEALFANGALTAEAGQAIQDYFDNELQLDPVLKALMADCPYEQYWIDQIAEDGFQSYFSYGMSSTDGETIQIQNGRMIVRIRVSMDYALITDNGDGTYSLNLNQVDPKYGQGVAAAVQNAQAIVNQYEGLNNYDRLLAYKDRICELVSYNNDAANEENHIPYGDPWQLIWVFDGDDSTNVVCEGYAKAFKYLNDLSDGSATVITVEGAMDGGDHMWNIVTIDGRNYLADITNSDTDAAGVNGELFLAGSADGSGSSGYWLSANGESIYYAYDPGQLYSVQALTLSDVSYLTYAACGPNCFWTFENGTLEITGSGPMVDYSRETRAPWRWNADQIVTGVISGVENIGSQTFWYCVNMTDVWIDTSVTRIDADAFTGCIALANIHYDGTPEMWDAIEIGAGNAALQYVYYGVQNILELPADLTTIGSEAFAGLEKADAVRIPAMVQQIANDAFSGSDIIIIAQADSVAAAWAEEHHMRLITE